MKVSGNLLAVDDPEEGRRSSERLLVNAVRIARWLGQGLRICSRSFQNAKAMGVLSEEERRIRIEWVSLGEEEQGADYGDRVLAETVERSLGLLLLEVRAAEARKKRLAAWKVKILEGSACPVLLLPPGYRFHPRGFESFFVPMSGESRSNTALDWAIRRGSELGVPVDILHVTREASEGKPDEAMIGQVGDQFYLEYPRLVDEFISGASPFTSRRQKMVIRDFCHCSGDPMSTVSVQIEKAYPKGFSGLLVLEWKGRFETGRALLVKQMIGRGDLPILLVKQGSACHARLKLGGAFEAA